MSRRTSQNAKRGLGASSRKGQEGHGAGGGPGSNKKEKRPALQNLSNNAVPSPQRSSLAAPSKMDISDDEIDVAAFGDDVGLLLGEHNDPQRCPEFAQDIYAYLHQAQHKYQAGDYLQLQTDITAHMTGILMDWLVEVAEEYHLNNETLQLAKHYIDRFLSVSKVSRSRLQLVGVAGMLVASKFEEVFPPCVDDFVYISDNTFSRAEVIAMETQMLNSLKFDLTNPTAVEFLTRYTNLANADFVVVSLAKYLVELTMLDYGMIAFLPSHIALACTMLATHTQHGHPALPRPLQRFVVDGERDAIGQCVFSIHKLWIAAPRSKLQAVRLKYERAKHYKVSAIAPPSTPPIF